MKKTKLHLIATATAAVLISSACNTGQSTNTEQKDSTATEAQPTKKEYISQPLVSDIYTADPSAHVFNGRIYIYPSHDTATGTPENDNGDHFNMMDYHILSMDS
ncbi:MAG TPA: hypothetical protein VGE90_00435, partial [Chitinophaga sp.]